MHASIYMHMNRILILTIDIFRVSFSFEFSLNCLKKLLYSHSTRDGTTRTVLRKDRTHDQIVKSWKDLKTWLPGTSLLPVISCKT